MQSTAKWGVVGQTQGHPAGVGLQVVDPVECRIAKAKLGIVASIDHETVRQLPRAA